MFEKSLLCVVNELGRMIDYAEYLSKCVSEILSANVQAAHCFVDYVSGGRKHVTSNTE